MCSLALAAIAVGTLYAAPLDRQACAVASYTFSTGDLVKVASAYDGDSDQLPPFVYLIESEHFDILLDRRDPLISSLLLRRELWDWMGAAKDITKTGLKIANAPPALQQALTGCFESMGFEIEGLSDKVIQVGLHENFVLDLEGESKKGSATFYSARADLQSQKSAEAQLVAGKFTDLRTALIDQVPVESRVRFVKAPRTRAQLAADLGEVQKSVEADIIELEKQSLEAQNVGLQAMYKNMAPGLSPLWSVPDSLSQLDEPRRKEFLNRLGFKDRGEYDRWKAAAIKSCELSLSFGLRLKDSVTQSYVLPIRVRNGP